MPRRYLMDFDPIGMDCEAVDFLVVGSGIAGLFCALKASDYGRVTVLTKLRMADTNTYLAQGGIAVALDEHDSPTLHRTDTLEAGAGLCDEAAVDILVNEGPARVGELMRMGMAFDQDKGSILFTHEAAHSRPRVIHASDATGSEIQYTLMRACSETREVEVEENCFLLDLLVDRSGECRGVVAFHQTRQRPIAFLARVTVLATGGAGQLFLNTTNPPIATGDGMAAAYRAGAQLMDIEFVQFHPTALAIPGAPQALISEAVRGEGGILITQKGERFMPRYHPRGELAPRDVVARAIWREMEEGNRVFLDVTHLPGEWLRRRFPNISKRCQEYGIDLTRTPIPVAPAAHYTMGGVRTDLWGQTSIPGLYACGEAACNGVHGGNRLASNSLLDGLVFGDRIVRRCRQDWIHREFSAPRDLVRLVGAVDVAEEEALLAWQPGGDPQLLKWQPPEHAGEIPTAPFCDPAAVKTELQQGMWEQVGLVRSAPALNQGWQRFAGWEHWLAGKVTDSRWAEIANMALLDRLTAQSALVRTESRGAHYREDFPAANDASWRRHLIWQKRR